MMRSFIVLLGVAAALLLTAGFLFLPPLPEAMAQRSKSNMNRTWNDSYRPCRTSASIISLCSAKHTYDRW
jgi:hypothetical protein